MIKIKINKSVLIISISIFAFVVGLGLFLIFTSDNPTQSASNQEKEEETKIVRKSAGFSKSWSTPPPLALDLNKSYFAIMHTSKGDIRLELLSKEVPVAVNSFVFLSKEGFYEKGIFHRVLKEMFIQGGMSHEGTYFSGYLFPDEKVTNNFKRGDVVYANAGPNTNSSQFFIAVRDMNDQKNSVIFGRVVEGMDIVVSIGH